MSNITISNIKIQHESTVKIPPINLIKLQMADYNRLNNSTITDEAAIKYYLRSYVCAYCAFAYDVYNSEHTPLSPMADTLWDNKCANLPTVGGISISFETSYPSNVTWNIADNKIHPRLADLFGNDTYSIAFELLAWHLPIDITIK